MAIALKREDFENRMVCISRGSPFGKPDLNRVEIGSRALMVKDVAKKRFLFRWTLGVWLIQKEWGIYCRLRGIQGIPKPIERIDRFAFVMEFVHGRSINRGEPLPPSFFSGLGQILREIHRRGVVHLDLRHKGNILVSEDGAPVLIDFNSSFYLGERGLLHRFLFPILRWVDQGGFLKLKQRASPELMTPEELSFLKRFNRIRKLWIFH